MLREANTLAALSGDLHALIGQFSVGPDAEAVATPAPVAPSALLPASTNGRARKPAPSSHGARSPVNGTRNNRIH